MENAKEYQVGDWFKNNTITVVTLVLQLVFFTIWLTRLDSRVQTVESIRIGAIEERFREIDKRMLAIEGLFNKMSIIEERQSSVIVRLGLMEGRQAVISDAMVKVANRLETILEKIGVPAPLPPGELQR